MICILIWYFFWKSFICTRTLEHLNTWIDWKDENVNIVCHTFSVHKEHKGGESKIKIKEKLKQIQCDHIGCNDTRPLP